MTQQVRDLEMSANELLGALLALEPSRRLSLLDSCGVEGAPLLIAGFDPFEVIEVRNGQARISRRGSDPREIFEAVALAFLDERLAEYKLISSPGQLFPSAACIGTLSYELAHQLERIGTPKENVCEHDEPDAVFAFYDTLVVHDYANKKTIIASSLGLERVDETEKALRGARADIDKDVSNTSIANSNMTRDEYLAAIDRIKEHISAGDIYQANLTQQYRCALADDLEPKDIFLRLRRDHPAPFAALIRRREDTVISISPERFLRVSSAQGERQVEAWPIKGTRPRGTNSREDARFLAELQNSEKDRAENVMIVDLLRNDLGRVCRYGSVEVASLCAIEKHPTLFHLVSKVRGALRDAVTAGELLRACFPCGSITGAPKIRAMEIIDEVETVPRGLSMGAIGYFGFDGSIDLSVAIRTMTVRNCVAQFNVGGGIVADSDPLQEYQESLLKASALFRALGAQEPRCAKTDRIGIKD